MTPTRLLLALLLALAPLCAALATEPRYVDVVFSIAADGSLLWTKVTRHSSAWTDEIAEGAILRAAPFRPLPAGAADHEEFIAHVSFWCTGPHDVIVKRVRPEHRPW